MNKYGIRHVQIHLTTLLEELPFQITRYGKVIAVVNGPSAGNVTVKQIETKTNLKTNFKLKVGQMCSHNLTYHQGCHF